VAVVALGEGGFVSLVLGARRTRTGCHGGGGHRLERRGVRRLGWAGLGLGLGFHHFHVKNCTCFAAQRVLFVHPQ
jgi:hypothetical protein